LAYNITKKLDVNSRSLVHNTVAALPCEMQKS